MTKLENAMSTSRACYEIPFDDLVGEVLIPACESADEILVASAYFTSESFAQIAPGLAAFVNETEAPLRLLLSPVLTGADEQALKDALLDPSAVAEAIGSRIIEEGRLSSSMVARHAVDCLSYLVAKGRLELKFVLMPKGQYHKKIWLFRSENSWLAVHGSGNVTGRGLLTNGEQMTVDRAWIDGERVAERVEQLLERWLAQWANMMPPSLTIEASPALSILKSLNTELPPQVEDFWKAWKKDREAGIAPPLPLSAPEEVSAPHLTIPDWLEWETGAFSHQGRAVKALEANGWRGVLAIATGGGKTKTALVSATQIQDIHTGPTIVVILVPSKPLVAQWAAEVRMFGIEPQIPSRLGQGARNAMLQELKMGLQAGHKRTDVLLVTNSLFVQDEGLRQFIESAPEQVQIVLIGDEVHRLGTTTFLRLAPSRCDARIGLSATPIRQYDPDGTDQLFEYFGPQVFELSLREAMDAGCLVRYNYILHEVALTHDEFEEYKNLTAQIVRAGARAEDDGREADSNGRVEQLLRKRRSILEHAEGKLPLLERILRETGPEKINRTLIYTSAKETPKGRKKQITEVNQLLSHLGIVSHQFTSVETASRVEAASLLESFAQGNYQALTAMKVLDEGVDVPQTNTAFLLASSAVKREWIQRRGRILRMTEGKAEAVLHDFLVVPPALTDDIGIRLVRGEMERAEEFVSVALNEWDADGPRLTVMDRNDV